MSAQGSMTQEQRKALAAAALAENQRKLDSFNTKYKYVQHFTEEDVDSAKRARKQQNAAKSGVKTRSSSSGGFKRGHEGLGDPEQNSIHYIASNGPVGEEGRYNLKYCTTGVENAAQAIPAFFQSPPMVVGYASFVGLGQEGFKDDSIFKRKWSLIAVYGIRQKDENGNLTFKLDTAPLFSKNRHKIWKDNNPMDRKEKNEKTLTFEINSFYQHYLNAKKQVIRFVASDPEDIVFSAGGTRALNITANATILADKWAQSLRDQMKEERDIDGSSDIPDLEIPMWQKTQMYQDVLVRCKEPAVESLMGFPDDAKISVDQFKALLTSSYAEDIMKNKSEIKGVGMTRQEILNAALAQADAYVEANPDWEKRLFILKYDLPVWKSPADLKQEDRKAQVKSAHVKYTDIYNHIKAENPNANKWDIKKLADLEFIPIATRKENGYEWRYNMPEIRDHTRDPVPDLSFTDDMDFYTKMHFAFHPGATGSTHFMFDISLPTATSFDYSLKLKMTNYFEFMFPSRYRRGFSKNYEHLLAFGESRDEYQSYISISRELDTETKEKAPATSMPRHVEDDNPNVFQKPTGLEGGMHGMTNNPNIHINPTDAMLKEFMAMSNIVSEKQALANTKNLVESAPEDTPELIPDLFNENAAPAASSKPQSSGSQRKRGRGF